MIQILLIGWVWVMCLRWIYDTMVFTTKVSTYLSFSWWSNNCSVAYSVIWSSNGIVCFAASWATHDWSRPDAFHSSPFFGELRVTHLFGILCCVFSFRCLRLLSCSQWCLCLWVVFSWFPHRFYFKFMADDGLLFTRFIFHLCPVVIDVCILIWSSRLFVYQFA